MQSFWEQQSFFAKQDIIIAGSGVVGLWCALALKTKYQKLKITILEKNIIPTGASTRNAGFACFGSPSELLSDIEQNGLDETLRIAEMRYKGIDKIRKYFDDDIIQYDSNNGYEVYNNQILKDKKFNEFLDEVNDLNKHLLAITKCDKTFTDASETIADKGLHSFEYMVENKCEGALHSGKYVQALIKEVINAGVQILNGIEITDWNKHNEKVVINTKTGIEFTCNHFIICTNGFSNALIKKSVTPGRGQIIVTSPIENLKLKGCFHFDEGYYYFRNVENRVLLGGGRNQFFSQEETTNMDTSENVQQHLETFLRNHILPEIPFIIDYRWSGIMGFTNDKKPLINKIDNNVLQVIACNGMGVALSPVIAESVAEMF